MIVTCPACSSRYKLDESKVTGRGAKITCPKCKHVFVVYPGGATSPLPDTAAPAAAAPADAARPTERFGQSEASRSAPNLAVPSIPPPRNDEWDDEPTRVGMQKPEFPEPAPRRPANPTLAAPYDTGAEFQITPEQAALRSPTLDFKKVGVPTWKVKIKIGLIYDFSDIKTLRKYIQDGRVTQQDVVSYDGKIWKALGEIPDLDVYFVQTWEELNRNRPKDAGGENIVQAPPKRVVEEAKPVATAAPAASPFRDPFAQRTVPTKKGGPVAAKPAAPDRTAAGAGVLVLLLAAAAAAFYFRPAADLSSARPPTASAPAPTPDKTQQEIRNDLIQKLGPVTTPDATAPVADPDADLNGNGIPDRKEPRAPVRGAPTPPPPSGDGARPPVAPPPVVKTPVAATQAAASGGDYAAAADGEAKSGNWTKAIEGYRQALALEPGNGSYLNKLGNAQYRSGDPDGAKAALQQAAEKGQKSAWKTLGNICKEQGDTTGASSFYQKYLATNPSDAAEIQAVLSSLSGG